MPIYEYRCERGHTFEVMQRMTDDPIAVCEEHGTPVQRVFHPVAVHFKGSGFYNTDYGKKKSGPAEGKSETGSESGSKSESSKSDSSKPDSSGSGAKKDSGSSSSGSSSSASGSSGSSGSGSTSSSSD
jgi:putative FmdB family regulatory protein